KTQGSYAAVALRPARSARKIAVVRDSCSKRRAAWLAFFVVSGVRRHAAYLHPAYTPGKRGNLFTDGYRPPGRHRLDDTFERRDHRYDLVRADGKGRAAFDSVGEGVQFCLDRIYFREIANLDLAAAAAQDELRFPQ